MQAEILIPRSFQEARTMYQAASKESGGLVLISICETGSFSLSIGGNRFHIGTGDILILPPDMPLEDSDADSGKADVRYLGVRYREFLRSIRTGRNVWTVLMYARSNPVFHLDENDRNLTSSYYKVIEGKLRTRKSYYYDEILHAILQCVIYELCVILNRDIGAVETAHPDTRKDMIFKQFMEMLSTDDGTHRSVRHYAEDLFVTPKYLSSVTQDICGESAHELILSNMTARIRQDLEFSQNGIKEIALRYHFKDLAVFGKFVKHRLGLSPREYRKRLQSF